MVRRENIGISGTTDGEISFYRKEEGKNMEHSEKTTATESSRIETTKVDDGGKHPGNKRKIALICAIIAAVAVVIAFFATANLRAYHAAQKNFSNGHYQTAMTQFETLDDYKDSKTQAKECAYRIASDQLDKKQYAKALKTFQKLGDYSDARTEASKCIYQLALIDYKNEKFQNALDRFNSIKDYKDSADKIKDCEYQLSPDGSFIRELGKGLDERWAQSDKDDAGKRPSLSEGAKCANYCDIELKHVEQFENQTFNDATLGTEAKSYIETLRKAKESTQYETIDYAKFMTDWTTQYTERSMLIQKFVQNNGLKVSAKYQNYLNELTTSGTGANAQKAAKDSIQKMVDGFKITMSTDEFGSKVYKMDMTNTTQMTFETFSVEISLLDAEGAIKYTGYSGMVSSWTPGQKATVDVYFNDMNVDPSKFTVKYVPRYQSGSTFG